jgi:hypothetical protein
MHTVSGSFLSPEALQDIAQMERADALEAQKITEANISLLASLHIISEIRYGTVNQSTSLEGGHDVRGQQACSCTALQGIVRMLFDDRSLREDVIDEITNSGVKNYVDLTNAVCKKYSVSDQFKKAPLLVEDAAVLYKNLKILSKVDHLRSEEEDKIAFLTRALQTIQKEEKVGFLCKIDDAFFGMVWDPNVTSWSLYDSHSQSAKRVNLADSPGSVYAAHLTAEQAADLISVMYPKDRTKSGREDRFSFVTQQVLFTDPEEKAEVPQDEAKLRAIKDRYIQGMQHTVGALPIPEDGTPGRGAGAAGGVSVWTPSSPLSHWVLSSKSFQNLVAFIKSLNSISIPGRPSLIQAIALLCIAYIGKRLLRK